MLQHSSLASNPRSNYLNTFSFWPQKSVRVLFQLKSKPQKVHKNLCDSFYELAEKKLYVRVIKTCKHFSARSAFCKGDVSVSSRARFGTRELKISKETIRRLLIHSACIKLHISPFHIISLSTSIWLYGRR